MRYYQKTPSAVLRALARELPLPAPYPLHPMYFDSNLFFDVYLGDSNLWARLILIGTRGLLRGEELRPRYSKLQILASEPLAAAGRYCNCAKLHASRFWHGWVSPMCVKG